MNDKQWEEKLRRFAEKTGQEFKRVGEDVKAEAERLLAEMKDPERQQKVRSGLKALGTWAKGTAEEVAHLVEEGVRKAERAWKQPPPARETPEAPPAAAQPPPSTPKPKAKAKSTATRKRPAGTKAAPAKKTIGKKAP